MSSFPFQQNLKDLRKFQEDTRESYEGISLTYDPLSSPPLQFTTNKVKTPESLKKQEEYANRLRIMVLIILCAIWEEFVKDLKDNDSTKYTSKFIKGKYYEIQFNDDIKEVFLIRNCFVHNGGKADDKYRLYSLQKIYPLDTLIVLNDSDINNYFNLLESNYKLIV